MIVFAIDPGFAATGVVVYDVKDGEILTSRTIRTAPSPNKKQLRVADDDFERLRYTAGELVGIMREYPKPWLVLFEMPTGGARSSRAVRSMSLITGVLAGVLTAMDIPYEAYTPVECKLAACGNRNAGKGDVEKGVIKYFETYNKWSKKKTDREHAIDAGSVLICALKSSPVLKFFKGD